MGALPAVYRGLKCASLLTAIGSSAHMSYLQQRQVGLSCKQLDRSKLSEHTRSKLDFLEANAGLVSKVRESACLYVALPPDAPGQQGEDLQARTAAAIEIVYDCDVWDSKLPQAQPGTLITDSAVDEAWAYFGIFMASLQSGVTQLVELKQVEHFLAAKYNEAFPLLTSTSTIKLYSSASKKTVCFTGLTGDMDEVTIKATAAKDVGSVRFGDEVELKSSDGQKQLHEPPQGWIFSSKPRFAACSQLATDDKTRKWRVVDPTSAKRTSKLRVGDIVSIQNNEGQRVFFGNHGCGIDRRTNQDEQKRRVNIVKAQP